METEPTKDKRLKLALGKLTSEQRGLYNDVLINQRQELLDQGRGRNVPVSERWEILGKVQKGEISLEKTAKVQSPVRSARTARNFTTFIDMSDPDRSDRVAD